MPRSGLRATSLLSPGFALVVTVAACDAFESSETTPGDEGDAAAAFADASVVDAPGPPPDAGAPDACAPEVAVLSHDPKGGRAYCVIVGPDGAAARLGTGLNGTINNENVNGCVRGTFASEAAQCP